MKFEEKTLDLTGFNRATFQGEIRIRHIVDWAHDYWKNGYTLARIKLHNDEYHKLIDEIRVDDMYIKNALVSGNVTFNAGFGDIEIINVDTKKPL